MNGSHQRESLFFPIALLDARVAKDAEETKQAIDFVLRLCVRNLIYGHAAFCGRLTTIIICGLILFFSGAFH